MLSVCEALRRYRFMYQAIELQGCYANITIKFTTTMMTNKMLTLTCLRNAYNFAASFKKVLIADSKRFLSRDFSLFVDKSNGRIFSASLACSSVLNVSFRHFSFSSSCANVPQIPVGELPMETRLFIGNRFLEATSDSQWDNINPATEEIICQLKEASEADVEMAVHEATKAFEKWSCSDGRFRAKCLLKLADLMEEHSNQLAFFESIDNGKPQAIAKAADLKLSVDTLRYYAGWADKLQGKTIPIESIGKGETDIYKNNNLLCFTKHEPIGVVGQIIPWNFPLLMLTWKIAPAVASGCTVVLKTSEKTPLSALSFAHLIPSAGFPAGVINILNGFGNTVGNSIATNPRINKIAFTGSTASGIKVLVSAAASGLKNTTLELGGKSPIIVFKDADLNQAVQTSYSGLFFNMGQCCVASSRVFVEECIYNEFVKKCVEKLSKTVICSPLDAKCTHGPQIDKIQYEKILKYIDCGKKEGAKCIAGGNALDRPGFWIQPTIFTDVKDEMTIAQDEIFGPVMCIMKFKTVDEVINRSNATRYGLGAGVCTRDIGKAYHVMNKLRAGTVYVNCYNVFDSAAPFGGFKESGIGRELGEYGLNQYLEVKTVITDLSFKE